MKFSAQLHFYSSNHRSTVKVKVKVILEQTMMAQRGSRGITVLFLDRRH